MLSNPIIEHCTTLRFGRSGLYYPELGDQLAVRSGRWACAPLFRTDAAQANGLQVEGTDTKWAEVQDFNWHKAQHSPNWSLVPDDAYPTESRDPELVTLRGRGQESAADEL